MFLFARIFFVRKFPPRALLGEEAGHKKSPTHDELQSSGLFRFRFDLNLIKRIPEMRRSL